MNVEGQQVLLLNEYDPRTSYYKFWNIEKHIRTIAESYQNTHTMAFCACCRQIYDKETDWGFMTKEDAEKYYGIEKATTPE